MLRLLPRAFAMVSVAALLSACSSMNWANPGSWIDTAAGGGAENTGEHSNVPPPPSAGDKPTVSSTTPTTTTASATTTGAGSPKPASSTSGKLPTETAATQPVDFPNAAQQPELQTPGTTDSQRKEIRDGLIADRDRAQHSADVLRGGTEKPAAPPAPKAADDKPTDSSATSTDAKPADTTAAAAPTN